MASPVSPIVANLYMEYFEQKALSTGPHPQALVEVWHNFQIIGRGHGLDRNIKESIFIRVNNSTLNRNIGTFNLPHI